MNTAVLLRHVDYADRLTFVFALISGVAACGGAPSSELFAESSDAADEASPSGDAALGAEADVAPDVGAQEATAADAGVADVTVPPNFDAGPRSVYCALGTQTPECFPPDFCCIQSGASVCEGSGSTCAGTAVNCDDTADCPPGQLCCETGAGTAQPQVSCSADCPSTSGTPGVQLCDPVVADCPAAAPNCMAKGALAGYYTCN